MLGAPKRGGHTAGGTAPPRLSTGLVEPAHGVRVGLDYLPVPQPDRWEDTALADAAGVVELSFVAPLDCVLWFDHFACSNDGAAASTVTIYVGSVSPANIVGISPVGNGVVIAPEHGILVPAGARVRVRWTGATATTSRSTVGAQYRRQSRAY